MEKYNFAVIGLGSIARTHLIGLKSADIIYTDRIFTNFNLHSLYRRSGSTELDFFNSVTSNLEDILENEDIDIVDICTPNFIHKEQCSRALEYDKHVYLEKPITSKIEDAEILNKKAEQAQKRGIINQVAFVLRYLPSVILAKEYIDKGYLGDIINFRAELFHSSYLNPDRPISWRLKKKFSGGGALMDLGIHLIDLIRFILGEVKVVNAEASCYFEERFSDSNMIDTEKVDVDEWARVNLILEKGGRGTAEASLISSELEPNPLLEIYGTEGKISIKTARPNYPEIYHYKKGVLEIGELNLNSDFIALHRKIYPADKADLGWFINTHLAGLIHFIYRLNTGEKFAELPDIEDGLLAQRVVNDAYISAEKNEI
ncbi:MAG: Gfo/Idh/MocA family protein [Bacillota bacterium]